MKSAIIGCGSIAAVHGTKSITGAGRRKPDRCGGCDTERAEAMGPGYGGFPTQTKNWGLLEKGD